MYLAWFDADRKKPVAQKIAEAHERYVAKFGRQPRVCLVNPEDAIADPSIELRPLTNIGRHCFWIGADDVEEVPAQPVPAPVIAAAPGGEEAAPPRAKRARNAKAPVATTAAPPPVAAQQIAIPAAPAPKARRAKTPDAPPVAARDTTPPATPPPAARRIEEAVAPPTTPIKRRVRRERPAA